MSSSEEHPTKEQKHKDFVEGLKISFDLFKHLTTLSTGSLILLATYLEKFFKAPHWSSLIGITFVSLIISLVGSLLLMFVFSQSIKNSGETDGPVDTIGVIGALYVRLVGSCVVLER